jgi:hypothetical protein
LGIWELGIGDWAKSTIPNPQSPIPNPHLKKFLIIFTSIIKQKFKNKNKIIIKKNEK